MSDEATNVTYDELTQEQNDIIEKSIEMFRVKCLESFGKTQNKVIQKVPLPKGLTSGELDEDKDTEHDKQIFQETIHQVVHHALICPYCTSSFKALQPMGSYDDLETIGAVPAVVTSQRSYRLC